MFIPVGRKEEGGRGRSSQVLPMVMNLGDFVVRPLRCFLTLLLFVASLLDVLVTDRCLLELWLSFGEHEQYLEQKFTFSLVVSSSSCVVLNPHVTILFAISVSGW